MQDDSNPQRDFLVKLRYDLLSVRPGVDTRTVPAPVVAEICQVALRLYDQVEDMRTVQKRLAAELERLQRNSAHGQLITVGSELDAHTLHAPKLRDHEIRGTESEMGNNERELLRAIAQTSRRYQQESGRAAQETFELEPLVALRDELMSLLDQLEELDIYDVHSSPTE